MKSVSGKEEVVTMNNTRHVTNQQDKGFIGLEEVLPAHPRLRGRVSSIKSMVLLALSRCLNIYAFLILLMALTLLALFVTSLRPTHVQMKSTRGSIPINLPLK